jgi:hypothetical protein
MFIKEFIIYIFARKKYWLIPIMLVLFLLGLITMLSQGSALAPFIYSIF